ncbi:hypothetical protein AYJ66_05540 [Dietzia cinnamea]|nr:hypothetical protein AYJ66_05540 [Dietzia cinnamea]
MNIPPSYVRGRMVGLGAIAALIIGVLIYLIIRFGLTGDWEQLWEGIGLFSYELTWTLRSLLPT